jgi:hypothetical protein
MKLPFFGKKDTSEQTPKPRKKTAKELAAESAAARRAHALEHGLVGHPEVEREYRRKRFFVVYETWIRAGIFVGIGLFVLLIGGAITFAVIRNLPGRDDDNDSVLNVNDVCPGFDDRLDEDDDDVPNGCEEIPPSTEIATLETNIVNRGQDRYDVAIKVRNPNQEWGVSPLEYAIHLTDSEGALINSSTRLKAYLLPGQEKYLTAFNILAIKQPVAAELSISLADWIKVQNYVPPLFATSTVSYDEVEEPGAFARLKGKAINHTTFTFDNIRVTILIRDAAGKLIGINQSGIETLRPSEERDFIVTFANEIAGVTSAGISYETDVDVFRNDSFVSTAVVKGQRFQQFTPQTPP